MNKVMNFTEASDLNKILSILSKMLFIANMCNYVATTTVSQISWQKSRKKPLCYVKINQSIISLSAKHVKNNNHSRNKICKQ